MVIGGKEFGKQLMLNRYYQIFERKVAMKKCFAIENIKMHFKPHHYKIPHMFGLPKGSKFKRVESQFC